MTAAPILYSTDGFGGLLLDPVEQAITTRGRPPVVVVDDEDRENEGDLVIAAERPPQRSSRS